MCFDNLSQVRMDRCGPDCGIEAGHEFVRIC